MAEILLDLTGKAGLTDNFFGDTDMVTPQPHLRINAQEGEMAAGLFNPYLRKGYMSPVTNTSTPVVLDYVPSTILSSSEYDSVNDVVFFGENGRYINIGNNIGTTNLYKQIDIGEGNILNDLSIYEVNTERKLFYTYLKNNAIHSANLDSRGDWTSILARVDNINSENINYVGGIEMTATGTTFTSDSFTIPSSSNMNAIIFLSVKGTTNTNVTIGGVAATLVSTTTRNIDDSAINTYVLYKSLTAGSHTIVVTNAASGYCVLNCVVYCNTAVVPVTYVDSRYASDFTPVNTIETLSKSKYIQYIISEQPVFNIANITVGTTYDPSAQTSGGGSGVAFSSDGTKMYVDGTVAGVTSIFQYTLSTAWDVSTATYASKTKNIDSEINDTVISISFSPDGTKLIMRGSSSGSVIKYWALSTAWDISTATHNAAYNYTVSITDTLLSYASAFSSDGLNMYVGYSSSVTLDKRDYVYHYTLGTAWQPSTAVYTSKLLVSDYVQSIAIGGDGSILLVKSLNNGNLYSYNLNPLYKGNLNYATPAYTTSVQNVTLPTAPLGIAIKYNGGKIYGRNNSNDDVATFNITTGTLPEISTTESYIFNTSSSSTTSMLLERFGDYVIDIGIASLSSSMGTTDSFVTDNTWLTNTLGINITTSTDYNFIRNADNGLAYLFTQNKVHGIDGGKTGGRDGRVITNIIKFPESHTITDAVDYRSRLYMAVHQYPVSVTTTSLNTYTGRCGILVWDRLSTQLGGTDFIELPGVREIKKIYVSPDQVLKLVTISDSGITEVREFGYNDSGGVVFRVMKELGIGAYPQFPDAHTTAGNRVMWIANDGNIYSEISGAVTKLFQVKTPGMTTETAANNIYSGAVIFGSGIETGSTGYRSNKQAFTFNYRDNLTTTVVDSLLTGSGYVDLYSGSTNYGRGQSFLNTNSNILHAATFFLRKTGSPTGNATVCVYRHTGTFGVDGLPLTDSASPIATSATLDVSTLTTSEVETTFLFEGAERIMLEANTNYFVVIKYNGGSAGNTLRVSSNSDAASHAGNAVRLTELLAWSIVTGSDMKFSILTNEEVYAKKIYPFDLTTGSNGAQTPHQGDVFTGVTYIPVTSVLRQVRVYNAPITGTGTNIVATIKLYFNQSSTVGMTKTVTKDEAKRGYVDFHINKPYIHAIQLEIEWNTAEPIGADMYLPSVAIITHDPTTTKSPDNG